MRDPSGITGCEVHAFDRGITLHENIARAMPEGGADCEVYINGQRVDPLTDARLDLPPGADDLVTVAHRPRGFDPVTWAYIIAAVLTVAAYASAPKVPGETVLNESPNNKLTGQTNIARTYQGIPDVYGYRRVWPDLIQPSVVEYIDNVKYVTEWLCVSRGKGTIEAIQYADTPLTDVDGASNVAFEPASGPSPYPELNTTTLTNVLEAFATPDVNGQELPFAVTAAGAVERPGRIEHLGGSSYALRFPDAAVWEPIKALALGSALRVEYIGGSSGPAGFDITTTLTSVTETAGPFVTFGLTLTSGVIDLTGNNPFEAAFRVSPPPGSLPATVVRGPFTLPAECDRIRFNLAFLRGLKGTAEIKAEWWKIDGSGAEVSGTRESRTYLGSDPPIERIAADSFDQQFFTRDITPAAGLGRYRIQFERVNATSTDGTDVAKLEGVFALRRYATKVLPGVTVVKVTTKATAQATGFSERKFNLRWTRHVRQIDSTTMGPSRNFARAMVHLWCVAGEPLSQLDTTTLAAINSEGGEALRRFDGTFDDAQMSLGDRLQRIADTARCTLWRDGDQWTVTRDQARTVPVAQLDYRNLAGGGDSVITYAAHLPASFDGVEVEYTDETTMASKAYVRLSIASGSVSTSTTPTNPKKISLPGCVTLAQASNRAHLEARRLLYQRTTVRDTALADGGQLGVGSLVRWIDPNDFAGDDGLQAGEVLTIAGSLITTSEPLDWKGQTSGRILFTGTNGQHLGAPVVCTPHSSGAVQLSSVPAGLFVADGVTRQLGSRYAFGVGLSEAEIQSAGLYLVQEVSPASDRTVSIALAAYDARMYEAD
jgi:hypothetical protein